MKYVSITYVFLLIQLIFGSCQTQKNDRIPNRAIWQSEAYAIYPDKVVQQQYSAAAVSPTELTSNYQSPNNNESRSTELIIKFSINGKDNEMVSGKDHHFNCISDETGCETPVITFGQQYVDTLNVPANTILAPNTKFTVRLDMRHVLKALVNQGYYTTFDGTKIFREDFQGVYIAGNTAPLMWDFDNLINHQELEMKDEDEDGIYEITLTINAPEPDKITASQWSLSTDLTSFPAYTSDYPLIDALYNMSLEEMQKNIEPDSTFRTGKEWAGVWTRDISYSVILSMATLHPKVSQYSLMRKVQNNRIIQDTGTGGAYPVSTDRIIWAVAAWEIYKVTGDKEWVRQAYDIIKNTVEDDLKNVYNKETGMVKGESSFLDWREQTYPGWMQPADIYESECLGTNAVHYKANIILAEMAGILKDEKASAKYQGIADRTKKAMNDFLWLSDKGYYGQYLYGRNFKILSPRAEALGEALSILYDIADEEKEKSIVAKTPVYEFGIPSISPQIPNIPPYHNNGIWPFVQAFWSLAAAKAGNEHVLTESMSALYRPAALFLTNKENFVANSGDYAGTQINSDRQLWSVAGNISMIYKVFYGMNFQTNSLIFKPFVPKAFRGEKRIINFKYRNAILDIELEGYGNEIKSITLDDNPLDNAEVSGNLKGKHQIKIVLANNTLQNQIQNKIEYVVSPSIPTVTLSGDALRWPQMEGVNRYKVLKNGKVISITENLSLKVPSEGYAAYQLIAIDREGIESFASEPLISTPGTIQIYELEQHFDKAAYPYKGFSGSGFVEITKQKNTHLKLDIKVPKTGLYALDFRYGNGNGPTNTKNMCAIRTLSINGVFAGAIVLPQRGAHEWSNWGYTNAVQVHMKEGMHSMTLTYEPENANMNGNVNQAMLDNLRIVMID